MRYHVNPGARPYECDRWDVLDSASGEVIATTGRGLFDALNFAAVLNRHFGAATHHSTEGEAADGFDIEHRAEALVG